MLVVIVDIEVRKDQVPSFLAATRQNAQASLGEPGIARFDVLSDPTSPTHFQLIEVYRSPDAPALHKETAHYQAWRDTVEPVMARPRSSSKYHSPFPEDEAW